MPNFQNTAPTAPKPQPTVALYKNAKSTEYVLKPLAFLYESVRTKNEALTRQIAAEFATNGKSKLYSELKTTHLQGATFALNSATRHSESIDYSDANTHTRRVTLDCDEATDDLLNIAYEVAIKTPFVEFAALSVSGTVNNHFWLNVKVEIPINYEAIPKTLRSLPEFNSKNWVQTLHKLYHKAAVYLLETAAEFEFVGKASHDITRLRFLAYSPKHYYNSEADSITLDTLCELITAKKIVYSDIKEPQKKQADKTAKIGETSTLDSILPSFNIDSKELKKAADIAENIAHQKFQYVDGKKNDFGFRFCGALFNLGLPYADAATIVSSYFETHDREHHLKTLRQVYKVTDSAFYGVKSYKLKSDFLSGAYTFTLQPRETISDYSDAIVDLVFNERKLLLKAPPAAGKSFAIGRTIAEKLNAAGYKVLLIEPTNILAKQLAYDIYLLPATGENLSSDEIKKSIFAEPIIVTNYANAAAVCEELSRQNKPFIAFIDECHELENGVNFKENHESDKLETALNLHAEGIIYYSATPTPYKLLEGFKAVNFAQKARPKIEVTASTFKGRLVDQVIRYITNNTNESTVLVCRINKHANIEVVQKRLLAAGYSPNQIAVISSSEEHKNNAAGERVATTKNGENSFAEDVKIVLCTSKLDCGISLYSTHKKIVCSYFTTHHHELTNFIQFFDRFRTTATKTVFYFYNDNTLEERAKALKNRLDPDQPPPKKLTDKIKAQEKKVADRESILSKATEKTKVAKTEKLECAKNSLELAQKKLAEYKQKREADREQLEERIAKLQRVINWRAAEFDNIGAFHKLQSFYTFQANYWSRIKTSFLQPQKRDFIQTTNNILIQNGDQVKVSTIAIAAKIENYRVAHTTFDSLKKQAIELGYFVFLEAPETIADEPTADPLLSKVKKNIKLSIENFDADLKTILQVTDGATTLTDEGDLLVSYLAKITRNKALKSLSSTNVPRTDFEGLQRKFGTILERIDRAVLIITRIKTLLDFNVALSKAIELSFAHEATFKDTFLKERCKYYLSFPADDNPQIEQFIEQNQCFVLWSFVNECIKQNKNFCADDIRLFIENILSETADAKVKCTFTDRELIVIVKAFFTVERVNVRGCFSAKYTAENSRKNNFDISVLGDA